MLNQIVLVGRLVRNPETKTLSSGKKVCEIVLAVQRSFKNVEGNYDTDFIKCSLWEGLAVSVSSYCEKGVMLAVKGRLQTWKYELDEEKYMNMLEVIAERVTYLSRPKSKDDDLEE